MNNETVNAVLNDSDAVCPCGADPRAADTLDGWHIDIVLVHTDERAPSTVVHEEAEVRCPRCW